MMRRYITIIALIGIMALAVVLRAAGLGFGLPYADSRPDELTLISKALGYGAGDFNPHYFNYPSFFTYILFACYSVYALFLLAIGMIHNAWEFAIFAAGNVEKFIFIARAVSAIAGSVTVLLVYILGKRLSGRMTGLLGALFLAISYLHVRESHFGVTDIMMTCFLVGGMVFVVDIACNGKWKSYILAAILIGFAGSTKYNAGLGALSLFAAHIGASSNREKKWCTKLFDKRLIFSALTMVCVFFLASPFVLLDFTSFARDFIYEVRHLAGAGENTGSRGWWHHIAVSLKFGVGPAMIVASCAGMLLGGFFRPRIALPLIIFVASYYTAIGKGYTVFVRYVVPLVPFICVFAGYALEKLYYLIRHRYGGGRAVLLITLLIVGVVHEPLYRSVQFDHLLTCKDTRQIAIESVQTIQPPVKQIGWIGTRYGRPLFSESAESLQAGQTKSLSSRWPGRFAKAKQEYALVSGYDLTLCDIDFKNQSKIPDIILVEVYPWLWAPQKIKQPETYLVEHGFVLQTTIRGIEGEAEDSVFDKQDSFYLPYAGFKSARAPGPNIQIWTQPQYSGGL